MNDLISIADTKHTLALQQHAQHAAGAYSKNTEAAIRSDTAIWSAWCSDHGHVPLPAAPAALVAFVDDMAATRAVATVRRYTASIAHLHRAAKLADPTKHETVKLAMKRIAKANGTRQKQAAPLTRDKIDKMIAACGDDLLGLRDRALIAVAYDTLCRRSELVALEVSDFDDDGTVLIRKSKTDQEAAGMVRFLAHDTCQHLVAWVSAAEIREGALFRAVRKGGKAINGALSGEDVRRIFKRRAAAAA